MKGVHHDEYGVLPHHTQEAMLHQVHQAQDVGGNLNICHPYQMHLAICHS
jgi:hypothetical protein